MQIDWLTHEALGPGRVGLCACPGTVSFRVPGNTSLGRDLRLIREADAARVVCLVPDEELVRLGVPELVSEVGRTGLAVSHFPLVDGDVPRRLDDFRALVKLLLSDVRRGAGVVVHCRAGYGRTGTVVASLLAAAGLEPSQAIAAVREVRDFAVENDRQERFVHEFAPAWHADGNS